MVEIEPGPSRLLLLTDQLDLPADVVSLTYRYRWQVKLFFRWLKCVLACHHWLGESLNALTLQVYVGLIARLLLTIYAKHWPNNRPLERVCHFFGWARA